MTGQGIVVPGEDVEALDERIQDFEVELKARGSVGRYHAQRAAMLTIRIERSARHESAILSTTMRGAEAAYDEARLAEVERLIQSIADDPYLHVSRLIKMPEGIDRLIEEF